MDSTDNEFEWQLGEHPTGMTINSETGAISWEPTIGDEASNPVTLYVFDKGIPVLSDTQSYL